MPTIGVDLMEEILELKQEIERVAKCESKVLVTGETGTGK